MATFVDDETDYKTWKSAKDFTIKDWNKKLKIPSSYD